MNMNERRLVAAILAAITVLVVIDLVTDSAEGAVWWHLLAEGLIALIAVAGIFLLLRGSFALRHSLEAEKSHSTRLQAEAAQWREQTRKYTEGLSQAIESQLATWGLTASEKEVAFLLLKGFSLKEIADMRKTTEKTARAQSMAVYAKAGLAGRSELAAFFLEDLFVGQNPS